MSKVLAIIAVSAIHFTLSQTVFSQITIKLPQIPKIVKQKPEQGKTGQGHLTPRNRERQIVLRNH